MTPDTPSDATLLRATVAGDTTAFDQFVTRHAAHVHRFLASLGVRDADADDAMQDTFVAAWRGAHGFRGDGTARAWLFTIARNAVRHTARRRVGEPDHFAPLDAADSLDAIALAAGWGSASESSTADRVQLVQVALQQLEALDRDILVLRDMEGLSGDETAAALELTLPAMKSRLHRARLRLAVIVRRLEHATDTPTSRPAPFRSGDAHA
ncbi:MAG: RNA polymerase sigma factor [Gemmatimonadaceae bacterium]|jgi:RNA polymerase sigma-70 factor (ECF subfamily)|nr:RNA polymerase sigma factor [Gemmatimonadaceae bacterium]